MARASDKELKKLLAALNAAGWRVQKTTRHWIVYPPAREQSPVVIDSTPSDHRAWANTLSRLRQRGYDG